MNGIGGQVAIERRITELERQNADLDVMRNALELRLSCQKSITLKVEHQRDELVRALEKYGSHRFGCAETSHEPKPCDCGLHAVLAMTKGK